MAIPTVVTDLSATIASNSPANTESPGDGDDYIRALSAFIRKSYDGTLTATFAVNANGVPYSTSMHNPGGTLTGTTNQLICSGTYTPSLTNGANVASSTANANTRYIRVGNVVSVWGVILLTPTAGTTATTIDISLPIASAMTLSSQLAGTATRDLSSATTVSAAITGDATNDTAEFSYYNDSDTSSRAWAFNFAYTIL